MKVAVITQYYAPEAIRIPDTLARQLVERGHSVRVITGYPNYPDGKIFDGFRQSWNNVEDVHGVAVRRVPLLISHSLNPVARFANYLTYALSAASRYRWIRSADVVYVYATQMTPAVGPSWWKRLTGMPYVMHVQDLWPESVTGSSMVGSGRAKRIIDALLNPWLRSLYRSATATIAIAPTMAQMLVERGVPEDRIHTVYNWSATESEQVRTTTEREAGQTALVYAGNLGDHQDLDTVIRAANLVKHIDGLTVTIVGSGVAEARLRALAAELEVTNVVFRGRVPAEDMGDIHATSDFQIVSLKNLNIFAGTIPSKFQASLCHGIPVITTVPGDVHELVKAHGLGFASPPEDVEQLAASFAAAAALSPVDRQKMGESAQAFYAQSMSVESAVEQIEQILTSGSRKKTKGKWN